MLTVGNVRVAGDLVEHHANKLWMVNDAVRATSDFFTSLLDLGTSFHCPEHAIAVNVSGV